MNDDIFNITARLYTLVGKAAADPMIAFLMQKYPTNQGALLAELRENAAQLEAIANDTGRR